MIKTEIIADSLSQKGDRLTSLLITFPRIVLSEVNNIEYLVKTEPYLELPFEKMVESIQNNPFIPIAWQKEHKGMQGTEYLIDVKDIADAQSVWLSARDEAIVQAEMLSKNEGVTKQLCNRLLEPFMWTTMLITGSKEGWDNFFNLRCPSYEWEYEEGVIKAKSKEEFLEMFIKRYPTNGEKELYDMELVDEHLNPNNSIDWFNLNKGQAEIHLMDLAEKIYDAMNESTPLELESEAWHIPFEDKLSGNNLSLEEMIKCSVAMAARTSYTVVGDEKEVDYQKMIELHDNLISQNLLPMEHCARTMSDEEYVSFIKGNLDAEIDADGYIDISTHINNHNSFGWCRNFKGFIPYRHIIEKDMLI